MSRRDCHGRANLTMLGVITLLALSGVGGFAFGKFFLGSRMKASASEVHAPDTLAQLQPETPSAGTTDEPRSYIRPLTGYSLTPDDPAVALQPPVDALLPLESAPAEEEPPQTPPATGGILETPVAPGTIFIVLIGSFLDQNNAVYWRDDLNNRGYRADIETVETGGQTFFRVVVGRFKDRTAADRVADKLKNEGYTVVVVTQAPPAAPATPPGGPV